MPKKTAASDYTESKRNPLKQVKTAKLRQRENHDRLTKGLGRLKEVQRCPNLPHWQVAELAAETLANQPIRNRRLNTTLAA